MRLPQLVAGALAVLSSALFSAGVLSASGLSGHAAAQARSGTAEGTRPACAEARGETRMLAFGWNHVVVVTNGCAAPIDCQVATDVDPTAVSVRVLPGETRETLTRRGSPASAFVAVADCEPAR